MLKALGFYAGGVQHSASTQSLSALDEPHALNQALQAMDLLMDDAVTDAEKALESGQSSFHKLAGGVIAFLGATLGFEADVMKEASDRLADAETSAERDRKKAVKENRHSGRLPPGTEYALCHAEAQLMSAVVGLLSESVPETLRSFYRLRTAYKTLEGIHSAVTKMKPESVGLVSSSSRVSLRSHSEKTPPGSSSECLEMEGPTTLQDVTGRKKSISKASLQRTTSSMAREELEEFTASGCSLCFGLLLLLVGMVPPSLARVMSVVGFRGDRQRGLSMLWDAAEVDNVHGAIAVLVILQYYGNAVQFCDILAPDNSEGGYPKDRCHRILTRIRQKYPNSALWKLEVARMEAVEGNIEKAVNMLSQPINTEMRQVEALIMFEKSLNSMFLHNYEDVAKSILELTTLNKWSHGLYHYFASVCYVELYRKFKGVDEKKSQAYAETAEELIIKVPTFMGKKRFMAQGLPLEAFADRKVKKWKARSTAKGVRLIDGVGVAPIEELIYVWSGYKRMDSDNQAISLTALEYGRADSEDPDEKAIRYLLESVVYRRKGELEKTQELLKKVIDVPTPKGAPHDEWMAPAAHYEMAVALWNQHGAGAHNEEVKGWLVKAANWGFSYELDTRVGMKIQTALDTINRHISQS